ncbi:hypothetical protein [Leucobacter sp. VD1]|uniref:hypothetical protein n=1 Tax=Leucobacter sp. VD1 TaxID=3080381 RepID=UPI003019437C
MRSGVARVFAVAALLLCVAALSGCVRAEKENGEVGVMLKSDVRDVAGLARSEVERMPLGEQFALLGERYDRLQDLLAEAQMQVSGDKWKYLTRGMAPENGLFAPGGALPGAGGEDSYYLGADRAIELPGAVGDRADLDSMLAYFDAQGWEYQINDVAEFHHEVYADTGDGYRLEYRVQANGWYVMSVSAGPFWGSDSVLTAEIVKRTPDEAFEDELTVPGVRVPFPAWDDPVVNPPKQKR